MGPGSMDETTMETMRNERTVEGSRAFTLLELLVVIGVMGLIAAMIVGLAKYATDQKKITRVTAELAKWSIMIDNYHNKLGFYPPCDPAAKYGPAVTPLFYELVGTEYDPGAYTYTTLTTRNLSGTNKVTITKADVDAAFGLKGLVNSATEKGEASCFGLEIQAADLLTVTLPGMSNPVKLPRVPAKGVPPWDANNTWHYNSKNPTNNPNSYDLWAEIVVGDKTNIIGNWKR